MRPPRARVWIGLLLVVGGAAAVGYGVLIETYIRTEVGSGANRFLAHLFYRSYIDDYRGRSRLYLVTGPAAILAGVWLLRARCRPGAEG